MSQQNQAMNYFSAHAREWHDKASAEADCSVNLIRQRNDFVLQVARERQRNERALDVGCGTGDLVCALAALRVEATGVDFSEEMIAIGREKAAVGGLHQANFQCCSIFDFQMRSETYDLISANGFIEYISFEELKAFFRQVSYALTPEGSLIIGSRNRLFNLFAANAFTALECSQGELESLMQEAIALNRTECLGDLMTLQPAPIQGEGTEHPDTGISVSTRLQYTPVQLMHTADLFGLKAVEILPVHIHPFPPSYKERNPALHGSLSNLLSTHARGNLTFMIQSSSFMMHLRRGR